MELPLPQTGKPGNRIQSELNLTLLTIEDSIKALASINLCSTFGWTDGSIPRSRLRDDICITIEYVDRDIAILFEI